MTTTPELAIRIARATFNRALADRDLLAIGPLLAPAAILVTGTDSAIISGRKAQLTQWQREFAAAERSIYTRTPETITVSPSSRSRSSMEAGKVSLTRAASRAPAATTRRSGGRSAATG